MMRKKVRLLAVLTALCLALSGCVSIQVFLPEDLFSDSSEDYVEQTESEVLLPEEDAKADQGTDSATKDKSKGNQTREGTKKDAPQAEAPYQFSLKDVPRFSNSPYVELNGNQPVFEDTTTTKAFETYSGLDKLGRCGVAFANICPELMPETDRAPIGLVKPSGWHSVKYDIVDGLYLFNRCHLIGYQLAGENANPCNLITGTRYLNVEGMLPFENMVGDYVKETGNHVLYRVTPVFVKKELVPRGVQMEAWSVEDEGEGICFNVWCYNNQPGVTIDYATGESALTKEKKDSSVVKTTYILNTKQKTFHLGSCSTLHSIKEENKKKCRSSREDLIAKGFKPCGTCKP